MADILCVGGAHGRHVCGGRIERADMVACSRKDYGIKIYAT